MAVAVQIISAFIHAVPRTKRIVAHDQVDPVTYYFLIRRDARPAGSRDCRLAVVVSSQEVLLSVEALKQQGYPLGRCAIGEVTQVPYSVLVADDLIPARHQRLVHFQYRSERPLEAA